MQWCFSHSKHPVVFDLIDEDEFEIGLFDPYVVFHPMSKLNSSYQAITLSFKSIHVSTTHIFTCYNRNLMLQSKGEILHFIVTISENQALL